MRLRGNVSQTRVSRLRVDGSVILGGVSHDDFVRVDIVRCVGGNVVVCVRT